MSDWKILNSVLYRKMNPDAMGIYVFYSEEKHIFYIGSSTRVKGRLKTQIKKLKPHRVKFKLMGTTEPHFRMNTESADYKTLRNLERYFIDRLRPKENLLIANSLSDSTMGNIKIPKNLLHKLQEIALNEGRSLTTHVTRLLENYIISMEKPHET